MDIRIIFSRQAIIAFLLFFVISFTAAGQVSRHFTDSQVTVGDDIFLPYRRGEVIMPPAGAPAAARRIADCIMLCDSINPPQGFKLTFYAEGAAMNIRFDPYLLIDGEVFAGAGAQADIWFNDLSPLLRQTVAADICIQPVKTTDYMGYPVYGIGTREVTVIYKGDESLFIPVSREEYLRVLIADEEKRRMENNNGVSEDEVLVEMKKVYKSLLETDKEAAAEFKVEMDGYAAALKEERPSADLLSLLIEELEKLTPEERKSQAFYEQGRIGEDDCFSGLADSRSPYASPLVRPNRKATATGDGSIHLIAISWSLGSADEDYSAPRLYRCRNRRGYGLTDCRLTDLYNDREVWSRIIGMVR